MPVSARRAVRPWLMGALVACAANSQAEPPVRPAQISIPSQAGFAPDFVISEAARSECDLAASAVEYLKDALARAGYEVTVQDRLTERAPGRVLLLEFASGESTGHAGLIVRDRANLLSIQGCLFESGKVTATFIDTRASSGGFAGEFKRTCAILHRIEKAIAEDVVKWLNDPPLFATLGDASGSNIQLPPGTPPFCIMSGKQPPAAPAP